MPEALARFPFGAASTARPPRRPTRPTALFVLGVYPSALHVGWTPPAWAREVPGVKAIGALAVADEPTVFWDGHDPDPDALVEEWKADHFVEGDHGGALGHVHQAGNGTSGQPVVERVLEPLGIDPDATWFTDCIDTYFVKHGSGTQGDAWNEHFAPFAQAAGLNPPTIPTRPTKAKLVAAAVAEHRDRLRREILESESPTVVTLGEEARLVLSSIADGASGPPTKPLTHGPSGDVAIDYGVAGTVEVADRRLAWRALVHPGQRGAKWRATHDAWLAAQITD